MARTAAHSQSSAVKEPDPLAVLRFDMVLFSTIRLRIDNLAKAGYHTVAYGKSHSKKENYHESTRWPVANGNRRPSPAGQYDLLPSARGCHRARRLLQRGGTEPGSIRPGSRFLVDGLRCDAPHPGQPGPLGAGPDGYSAGLPWLGTVSVGRGRRNLDAGLRLLAVPPASRSRAHLGAAGRLWNRCRGGWACRPR